VLWAELDCSNINKRETMTQTGRSNLPLQLDQEMIAHEDVRNLKGHHRSLIEKGDNHISHSEQKSEQEDAIELKQRNMTK